MSKIRVLLLTIMTVAILAVGIFSVNAAINSNGLIAAKQNEKSKGNPSTRSSRLLIKYKDNQNTQTVKDNVKKKLKLKKVETKKHLKRTKVDVIEVDENADITKVKEELVKDPNVEYVQSDFELELFAEQEDEKFDMQWALENDGQDISGQKGVEGMDINPTDAWSKTKGSKDIVIGVIDTGMDINHPEIEDNIFKNTLEIPGNGIDDDSNGYIDDINGWDFFNVDNNVSDNTSDENHGTHIAGIIAAKEGNGGIRGIAPNVKILSLKFSENGKGYTSSVIEAIEYAKKMGVRIINCSFGANNYNPALLDAIKNSGMLFICAAGNNGSAEPIYPAAFELPNVVSVTAIDNKGALASFSNFNASVDVAAPGVNVLSIAPNNRYDYYSGTSSAAPQITGIAALLQSYQPGLMPNDMALTIKKNANKKITGTEIKMANASEALNNILIYSGGEELPLQERDKKIYTDQELEMLTVGESKLLVEQLHYGEDGVSPSSGNFSRTYVDMSIESPTGGISISRTYNSIDDNYNFMGQGWTPPYEGYIQTYKDCPGRVIVTLPGGGSETFVSYGMNTYVSDISNGSRGSLLTIENGSYKLTTKDLYTYTFDPVGRLCKIEDKNKNTITLEFEQGNNGKIISITDQQGHIFDIKYNSNQNIDHITDTSNNRIVKYQYENNRLQSVIDPMNNTIYTYSYDNKGKLNAVKDASLNTIETISYDYSTVSAGKVYQHTLYVTPQKSNTYTYSYNTTSKTTTITDSNNRTITKKYDDYMYLISSIDPEYKETKVEYYNNYSYIWNQIDGHYPRDYKPWAISRNNAAIAEYDGKIYYFGGENAYSVQTGEYSWSYYQQSISAADYFNTSTVTWSQISSIPEYSSYGYSMASAAVKGGEIYVAGGMTINNSNGTEFRTGLKSMYKYTPSNNVWTKMPDMSRTRYGHELVTLNNELYVIGGQTSDSTYVGNLVEKFNGTRWTTVGSTLYSCSAFNGRISAVVDGKLYVCDDAGNLELYDPVSNCWSIFDTNAPYGEILVLSNNIYSVNGKNKTVYKYNMSKKCWDFIQSDTISYPREYEISNSYFYRAAVGGDQIYVIYGDTSRTNYFTSNLCVYQGSYNTTNQINFYGEEEIITDRANNVYQYERDNRGNITKVINPDKSYEIYTYNVKNNVLSEMDAEGKYVFHVYDAEGINLLKTAVPLNGTDVYTDGQSDPSKFSITQYSYYTEAERIQKGYKVKGLLKSVIDPNGNTTIYNYDANGNINTVTDENTNILSKSEYYNTGLIQATITPLGYRTDYIYDSDGRLEKTLYDGRDTTRITYNATGRKEKEVAPKQYTASLDNLAAHTYSGAHGTRYTYYSSGKVLTMTDAENNTTTYNEYDLYGNLKKETRANGAIFEYDYDVMNRLSKVYLTDKAGQPKKLLEEYLYNILADKKTQKIQKTYETANKAIVTTYTYDYAGRQLEQLNNDTTKITNEYYKNGKLKYVIDPKQNKTEYVYDQVEGTNRYDTVKTPFEEINGVTYYTVSKNYYDKNGNVIKSTVTSNKPGEPEKLKETRDEYDKRNRLVKVTSYNKGAVENIFQYYYDADGNKVRMYQGLTSPLIINGLDNVVPTGDGTYTTTKYDYDRNNRLSKIIDPTSKEEKYDQYDPNGNLTHKLDKNGSVSTMTYDNLNRIKTNTVTTVDGKGNVSTTYNYDDKNRKVTIANNGETTTLDYDGMGRLLKETVPGSITKQYTYNDNGTRETFISQQGTTIINNTAYEYDDMGRLHIVKEGGKGGQQVATYKYDQNGNRETITYGNNVTESYHYNLANRVDTLVNKNAAGAVLSQFNYTYYLDANEATKTDAQGQTTYEYDGLGRLENTQEPGNVTRIYTYDDRNNRSGMVTNGPLYENPVNMSYEYDGLDRLTKATGLQTSTYKYNADGIRQSKTVDGVTTTHVLDGADVVADITGTNKTKYVRGINLICMEKNGQRYYYLFDGHGNVVQMVDANGNVVNNYTYDEWGNIPSQTEGVENPFKYCGEYWDKETGTIYLRARYYDPEIGRFITEDSYLGKDSDPLSLNLYTYCTNNPINFIDPSGHLEKSDNIAWANGEISQDDYDKLVALGKMYSETDDKYVKAACRQASVAIRRSTYDSNYKDNFDYTFGGTFKRDSNSMTFVSFFKLGKKEAVIWSMFCKFSFGAATAAITYEIPVINKNIYTSGAAGGLLSWLGLSDAKPGVYAQIVKWVHDPNNPKYGGSYLSITRGPDDSGYNKSDYYSNPYTDEAVQTMIDWHP